MSTIIPETYGSIGPWQRYVAKEHAARDAYITTIQSAHREYLTGPWPDREAYQHVEQSAWVTYYAAGREAWRHYTRELIPPPPPPVPSSAPARTYPATDQWDNDLTGAPYHPTFTERPERMQ